MKTYKLYKFCFLKGFENRNGDNTVHEMVKNSNAENNSPKECKSAFFVKLCGGSEGVNCNNLPKSVENCTNYKRYV